MVQERAVVQSRPATAVEAHQADVIQTGDGGFLEKISRTVTIPAIYQYPMKRWNQPDKISLTSEAYAYINRELGVTFVKADKVPDTDGSMANNPIHRGTYIYVRAIGVWRTRNGQLVSHSEDVEVDYQLVWQDARINAKSATVVTDKDGVPQTVDGRPVHEGGLPMVKLSGEDELKAMKAFSQLRTYGLRYVQTIAATRILKRATGISSLPITAPQDFPIEVVTWRDNLTANERVRQAGVDLAAMYGKGEVMSKEDFLTSDELKQVGEIEGDDFHDDVSADADEGALEQQEDRHQFDASVRRVGPDEADPEGIFDAKPRRRPQA